MTILMKSEIFGAATTGVGSRSSSKVDSSSHTDLVKATSFCPTWVSTI